MGCIEIIWVGPWKLLPGIGKWAISKQLWSSSKAAELDDFVLTLKGSFQEMHSERWCYSCGNSCGGPNFSKSGPLAYIYIYRATWGARVCNYCLQEGHCKCQCLLLKSKVKQDFPLHASALYFGKETSMCGPKCLSFESFIAYAVVVVRVFQLRYAWHRC